ncbi:MAG: amidohydrolase family protein [Gammaproteobacteria bacterium]
MTASPTLIVRNALIVDGTGQPARPGSVAVTGDRITQVGQVQGSAAREIDARGRVLAPGFIDIHTHYDPQLCWDRLATPSPEHGVTSLIMGNCSVTLAPVRPEHRARIIQLFGSVEDMESRLLEDTVPFQWRTYAEYVDYLRRDLGPNVGAFVGHAVIRLLVMGAAAQERAATDAEIEAMCGELRAALRAGAFGLSFTYIHLDELGRELPCHYADMRELQALFAVMAEEGRGMAEVAPPLMSGADVVCACIDRFGELASATGVTCSISPLLQMPVFGDLWRRMLARFEHWQARGAPLYAQTQVRPGTSNMQLARGSAGLSKGRHWRRLFELPIPERIALLRDPSMRALLREETDTLPGARGLFVQRVQAVRNRKYEGRLVADIAAAEDRPLFDVIADIALDDDLTAEFGQGGSVQADTGIVSQLLNHPGIHIGAGDAGAHINQFAGAGDTCYLFEKFVRELGAMSLERAVHRLTGELAHRWNIADRGEIAPGRFADLVIFDPATIARGEEVWVQDVPGDNGRYVRHPQGIEQVIVNGEVLVDQGRYTTARPGRIL